MTEETKPQVEAESVQEAPSTETPTGPDLTVQDLQALKTIIDVASQRGSFRPAEMEIVGKTYNRLTQFLDAVSPKDEDNGAAEAPKE